MFGIILCLTAILCNFTVNFANGEVQANATLPPTDYNNPDLYSNTNTYNYREDKVDIDENKNRKIKPDIYYDNEVRYDLNNRNGNIVDDGEPMITVLTHGLGGGAYYWSNNGSNTFAYAKHSLITRLYEATENKAAVIWAKMMSNNLLELRDITSTLDNCISTNLSNGYSFDELNRYNIINKLTDISKHIIVVFEAAQPGKKNDVVYSEFNYMLSRIVYDVKALNNGKLPKINLIGHSRGGITNMQYALDHPYMVASIYSLGTPYWGSTTASIDAKWINHEFAGQKNAEGEDDIVNQKTYAKYMKQWNDNYDNGLHLYDNIKVTAIGGYCTLLFLQGIIWDDSTLNYFGGGAGAIAAATGIDVALAALTVIAPSRGLARIASDIAALFDLGDDAANDLAQILFSEIKYNRNFPFKAWHNDGLVHLSSQLGYAGGSDIHNDEYKGFERIEKCFTLKNCDRSKKSQVDPPVVHNLEAMDEELLNNIVFNIKMTGKSLKEYSTYDVADGVGIKYYTGAEKNVTIPSYIGGKVVRELGSHTFSSNRNLEKIVIPATVTKIGGYAFSGCKNLTDVSFYDADGSGIALEYIGYGAFEDCNSLSSFNGENGELCIPDGIKNINENAFSCINGITKITIPNSVEIIDIGAFSFIANLTEIEVAADNTNFFSYDGNLYTTSGKLQQYAIGKTDENFVVPESVTVGERTVKIKEIGGQAFLNAKNLKSVNLSDVDKIHSYAFWGCTNLNNIIVKNLTFVGENAFTETQWYKNQTGDFIGLGNTLLRYNGDEEKVVLDSFTTIACAAFTGNEFLKNITILNNVTNICDYAFSGCYNLGSLKFYSYNSPNVGRNVLMNDYCLIFVPYDSQEEYKNAFSEDKSKIQSQQSNVIFKCQNETLEIREVFYGQTISDLPEPSVEGYTFEGWFDSEDYSGAQYVNGGKWEVEETTILYAKMTPKQYTVFFNADGGTVQGENPITVTYGASDKINTVATKDGHILDGWFDVNGVEYITADGEFTRIWDKAENTVLTARWTVKSYEIQINNDGTITWLGKDGLSNEQCSIEYGTIIDTVNLIDTFKKSAQGFKAGKIFERFEYEGEEIKWRALPDLGENGKIISIIPKWINEIHTIYFDTSCEIFVDSIVEEYGTDINLPSIARVGYTFLGWYDKKSDGEKITWLKMPDLTLNDQSNGSVTIYAHWEINSYNVYYRSNDGSGITYSDLFECHKSYNLKKNPFNRRGHDFVGWATSPTGAVEYSDAQSVENLTTVNNGYINLYAVWHAKTYNIEFKNLMDSMRVFINTYTYGVGLQEMPVINIKKGYYNYEPMDNFYGWYTSDKFEQRVTSISTTQTGTVTVYGLYEYRVTGFPTMTSTQTVTDGKIFEQPYYSIDILLGEVYFNEVKNTTLSKIKIEFSLTLWEVDDGFQDFYLYNGETVVWSKTIEHGVGSKNTAHANYSFEIILDITDFAHVNFLDLRFGAHGRFGDTWQFNNIKMDVYFTN